MKQQRPLSKGTEKKNRETDWAEVLNKRGGGSPNDYSPKTQIGGGHKNKREFLGSKPLTHLTPKFPSSRKARKIRKHGGRKKHTHHNNTRGRGPAVNRLLQRLGTKLLGLYREKQKKGKKGKMKISGLWKTKPNKKGLGPSNVI